MFEAKTPCLFVMSQRLVLQAIELLSEAAKSIEEGKSPDVSVRRAKTVLESLQTDMNFFSADLPKASVVGSFGEDSLKATLQTAMEFSRLSDKQIKIAQENIKAPGNGAVFLNRDGYKIFVFIDDSVRPNSTIKECPEMFETINIQGGVIDQEGNWVPA